ncbi:MAG: hypothetical protein Q9M35_07930, partial [Rhodothermus sp.]|nr:hypothetical protein [Rhodothermus sp.]
FRVVGILEDRSRALAWRYAAGMAFPFAVWWDSLGWYGRHYGAALLPGVVVRWVGGVGGELGPEVLRTVRGVESVRLLLAAFLCDEQEGFLYLVTDQPQGGAR